MSKLTFAEKAWEEYLYWQTIDDVNRLVYQLKTDASVDVLQCKGHYDN